MAEWPHTQTQCMQCPANWVNLGVTSGMQNNTWFGAKQEKCLPQA